MNDMRHVCKKVVVGAFLIGSVDFSSVYAMAMTIPKPVAAAKMQTQTVPLAIPVVATVEDTYTFSPQHDSAFNYWVDAQQDNFAECRVVVDGVKKAFGSLKKTESASAQQGNTVTVAAGVVSQAAVVSDTKADATGQKNSAPDTKVENACKKRTAPALDVDDAKLDKNQLVLACANCGSRCITLEPYKKNLEIADQKKDESEKTVPTPESNKVVLNTSSTLRTLLLTTGQVGIGAVAGYLLFRMGLSVFKSLEKRRHTRTITFDEE